MKRQIILNSFLFLVLFSLKSQVNNNPGPKATKEPTVYKGVTDKTCAAEVAFGSYGSGIDGKAYEKVIATIQQYKVSHTAKTIGREGETRICLPLTELKKKKKKEFIDALKKIAKEGQLVSVSIR
jgi:hypothetical protein